jgi:hypothetical protein
MVGVRHGRRVRMYDIDFARVTNDDEQTNKTGTTENIIPGWDQKKNCVMHKMKPQ